MSIGASVRFQTRDFAEDQSLDCFLEDGTACVALTGLAAVLHQFPGLRPGLCYAAPAGLSKIQALKGRDSRAQGETLGLRRAHVKLCKGGTGDGESLRASLVYGSEMRVKGRASCRTPKGCSED